MTDKKYTIIKQPIERSRHACSRPIPRESLEGMVVQCDECKRYWRLDFIPDSCGGVWGWVEVPRA